MSLTRRPRRFPSARPHTVLHFSLNSSKSRERLKVSLAAFVTAILAIGLVAVGGAAPASAHHNTITAAVSCSSDYQWQVTWTVANSQSDKSETITASSNEALVPVGTVLAAGATKTFVETFAKPADKTLTLDGLWDNGITSSNSGSVILAQFANGCAAPIAQCIPDSAISYTYDPANNSGVVTVANPKGSTGVLCKPLYITATSWKYKQNAVWGQTLDQVNKVAITKPGTYQYSAALSCGQGDIYASRTAFILPTPELTGPQPWEKFLSGLGFATSTRGNTYTQQPTNCFGLVVPVAPAITTASECGVYGTVTPAVTDGVLYTTVFTKATGAYTVTATPTAGHHFAGGEKSKVWSGSVGAYVECVLKPTVTISTGECHADAGYSSKTVIAVFNNVSSNVAVTFAGAGVSETVPAGTSKTVQLSPVGKAGSSLVFTAAGQTFTFAVPAFADCGAETIPTDPTSHDQVCLSDSEAGTLVGGYISVALQTGVRYTIHNVADANATNDIVVTKADTPLEPGTYRVSAEALPGYTLAPFEPFPLYTIASAGACEQLPSHALADGSATGTSQSCTANSLKSGYITVALDQGLSYFIGGTELTSAVTNEKPGTYVVTGVAQDGFQWNGDPWTIVIASAGSACLTAVTELKTLAYTGYTGGAGYVGLAGLMLLLGGALIIWSRRRNVQS